MDIIWAYKITGDDKFKQKEIWIEQRNQSLTKNFQKKQQELKQLHIC